MKKTLLTLVGATLALAAGATTPTANPGTMGRTNIMEPPSGMKILAGDKIAADAYIDGSILEPGAQEATHMSRAPKTGVSKAATRGIDVAYINVKLEGGLPQNVKYAYVYIMDPDFIEDSGTLTDEVEMEVPATGCDVVVRCQSNPVFYFLMKHVDPSVTDEVVFNFEEDAICHLGHRPVDNQGNELIWSRGFKDQPLLTEGNIVEADIMPIVFHKKAHTIQYGGWIGGWATLYSDYEKQDCYYGDILTNLTPEDTDYTVMLASQYVVKGQEAPVSYTINFTKENWDIVSNTADQFVFMAPKIEHTPAATLAPHKFATSNSVGVANFGNYILGWGGVDLPLSDYHCTLNGGADQFLGVLDFGVFDGVDLSVETPDIVVGGDLEAIAAFNPMSISLGRSYEFDSPYYYELQQADQPYGVGPTFMRLNNIMFKQGENAPFWGSISYASFGFLADRRTVCDSTTMASVKFNGEKIFSDEIPAELNKKMDSWYKQNTEPGTLEFTYVDKNYKLGDIDGKITSVMTIVQEAEENSAPMLYGLVVKDAQGNVGSMFPESSNEDITIYATIADENIDLTTLDFNIDRASDVFILVSEHDADAFEMLDAVEFNETPSNSYGYTYCASMKDIFHKSKSGYYDLQIFAIDDCGNRVVETISPAIYVNPDASGINTAVGNRGEVVSSRYYDMIGRAVANPSNGVYVRIDTFSDGSTKTVKTFVNK